MVQITRISTYADGLRPYKVVCNGTVVAEISSGQTQQLTIPPGPATLHLKIDWCRSRKLHLVIAEEPVHLFCRSSLRGWKILLAPLYISLLRSRYILLEEAGNAPLLGKEIARTHRLQE